MYRLSWWNCNYASHSSVKAYRDRQLTINFELWVEIFCVPTCFHMRIPKSCLSVCTGEKKSPWFRQYQSFIRNWYINGKVIACTAARKPKIWILKKSSKLNFDLCQRAEINLSFANISPTLVIDTSIERPSRVLQHGNLKNWFFFKKVRNLILTSAEELKSTFK